MSARPNVALFVTCLVDFFRPQVGFASVKLLEAAGCAVAVPEGQTCCGQPGYNAGDRAAAAALGRRTIAMLEPYEAVVVPSGSCAGMIRVHYPELFAADAAWAGRATALAAKTYELTEFLARRGAAPLAVRHDGTIAYHDSCSALRELGVRDQPRALIAAIPGASVAELAERDTCCGFGGTFCVKYPAISTRMVADKVADISATGAATVASGDMGCLLNIAGLLKRAGSPVQARHVAEILAGTGGPGIGED